VLKNCPGSPFASLIIYGAWHCLHRLLWTPVASLLVKQVQLRVCSILTRHPLVFLFECTRVDTLAWDHAPCIAMVHHGEPFLTLARCIAMHRDALTLRWHSYGWPCYSTSDFSIATKLDQSALVVLRPYTKHLAHKDACRPRA
jgi:hypothetical protein